MIFFLLVILKVVLAHTPSINRKSFEEFHNRLPRRIKLKILEDGCIRWKPKDYSNLWYRNPKVTIKTVEAEIPWLRMSKEDIVNPAVQKVYPVKVVQDILSLLPNVSLTEILDKCEDVYVVYDCDSLVRVSRMDMMNGVVCEVDIMRYEEEVMGFRTITQTLKAVVMTMTILLGFPILSFVLYHFFNWCLDEMTVRREDRMSYSGKVGCGVFWSSLIVTVAQIVFLANFDEGFINLLK